MLVILDEYQRLARSGREAVFVWIPSHVGLSGNEEADRLAKGALTRDQIESNIGWELSDARRAPRNGTLARWQALWDEETNGADYRIREPKVSYQTKYLDKPRLKEVTCTRLRFGKTALNGYLNKSGCHETGQCDTCDDTETIGHFLLHCPKQSDLTWKLKSELMHCNRTATLQNVLSSSSCINIIYNWLLTDGRRI